MIRRFRRLPIRRRFAQAKQLVNYCETKVTTLPNGLRVATEDMGRGGHSDKISCFVRPTAEPRSKIFGLSDRKPSRAELSDCPKIARLGSRLGSRALFRTNSDIGQPSSRDFWNLI
ncbi:unnamed protein product [Oikopleura dioica]|uniref:Uncharacterized protein n=1 Tax=Oikopleura dioica TaxID=34765 RepID=E4XT30_OIKDI|nr:unnamed protein product [Oikopleura dioica]